MTFHCDEHCLGHRITFSGSVRSAQHSLRRVGHSGGMAEPGQVLATWESSPSPPAPQLGRRVTRQLEIGDR